MGIGAGGQQIGAKVQTNTEGIAGNSISGNQHTNLGPNGQKSLANANSADLNPNLGPNGQPLTNALAVGANGQSLGQIDANGAGKNEQGIGIDANGQTIGNQQLGGAKGLLTANGGQQTNIGQASNDQAVNTQGLANGTSAS